MHKPIIPGPMQINVKGSMKKLPGAFPMVSKSGKADLSGATVAGVGEDAGFGPILSKGLADLSAVPPKTPADGQAGAVAKRMRFVGSGKDEPAAKATDGNGFSTVQEDRLVEPGVFRVAGEMPLPAPSLSPFPTDSRWPAVAGLSGSAAITADGPQIDSQDRLEVPDNFSSTNNGDARHHGGLKSGDVETAGPTEFIATPVRTESMPAPVAEDHQGRPDQDGTLLDHLAEVVVASLREKDFDGQAIGEILAAFKERGEAGRGTAVARPRIDANESIRVAPQPVDEPAADRPDVFRTAASPVQPQERAASEGNLVANKAGGASPQRGRFEKSKAMVALVAEGAPSGLFVGEKTVGTVLPAQNAAGTSALEVDPQGAWPFRAAGSGQTRIQSSVDRLPFPQRQPVELQETLSAILKERGIGDQAIGEIVKAAGEGFESVRKTAASDPRAGHTEVGGTAERFTERAAGSDGPGRKPYAGALQSGNGTVAAVDARGEKKTGSAVQPREPLTAADRKGNTQAPETVAGNPPAGEEPNTVLPRGKAPEREAATVVTREGEPFEVPASHSERPVAPKFVIPAQKTTEPLTLAATTRGGGPFGSQDSDAERPVAPKFVIPAQKTTEPLTLAAATRVGETFRSQDSDTERPVAPKFVIPAQKTTEPLTLTAATRVGETFRSQDSDTEPPAELKFLNPGKKAAEPVTSAAPIRGERISGAVDIHLARPDSDAGRPAFTDKRNVEPTELQAAAPRERGGKARITGEIPTTVGQPTEAIGDTESGLYLGGAKVVATAVQPGEEPVVGRNPDAGRHAGGPVAQEEASGAVAKGAVLQANENAAKLAVRAGDSTTASEPEAAGATAAKVSGEGIKPDTARSDGQGDKPAFAEKGKVDLKEAPPAGRMDFAVAGGQAAAPKTNDARPVDGALLVDQIAGQLTSEANNGSGRVRITLSPDHLGGLDLDIIIQENKVQVVLTAERNDVRQALQSHVEQLRNALQDQGLQISGIDVLLRGNLPGTNGESAGGHLWWRENNNGSPRRGRNEDRLSLVSTITALAPQKDPSAAGISLYV
jgi:hypothetical protein